jgi:D-2-hydroxyacid dehydrogenase (NADP+)
MTHHILILDEDAVVYKDAIERENLGVQVTAARTSAEAHDALSSATVLVALDPRITAEVIGRAQQLKLVQALTTGTDAAQRATAARSDIALTSVKGIHGEVMSEFALLQMLALQKGFPTFLKQQSERIWQRNRHGSLSGKTVGILGIGQISTTLAERLHAFGMKVVGFSSSTDRPFPEFDRVVYRDELVAEASALDFLVILVPLSDATRNIVSAEVLNAMQPTAFVINLARGGVLDEVALKSCLDEGRIAGAALDVFAEEPLPASNPLWDCPNLLITPHVGANVDDYAHRASAVVVENVRRLVAGASPSDLLNHVRR